MQNLEIAKMWILTFSMFQAGILIFMFIVYPLLSNWKIYKKYDYRSLVSEFRLVKNLIIVSFVVIISSTLILNVNQGINANQRNYLTESLNTNESSNGNESSQVMTDNSIQATDNSTSEIVLESGSTLSATCTEVEQMVPGIHIFCIGAELIEIIDTNSIWFYSIATIAYLIFYSGVVKILFLILRKDFRFYLAKGYVSTGTTKKSDVDKMRYVGLCLKSYDAYLKKRLDLNIKDLSQIFGKMFGSKADLNDTVDSLNLSFNKEMLGPLKYLVSLSPHQQIDQLLTAEVIKPVTEIIKEYGIWFASVIPALILVVQFILNPNQ